MNILILNRTIAENFINISNQDIFFEYKEMIVLVELGFDWIEFERAPTGITTTLYSKNDSS